MNKEIFITAAVLFGAVVTNYKKERKNAYCLQKTDKVLREMRLFEQWLFVKQDGKQLCDYFYKRKMNTIAIYGMGNIGERLYDELSGQGITVKYAIDQKGKRICADIKIVSNSDISMLESVDVIVVTTIHCFEDVKKRISAKLNIPVVSLEEILYEV